MTTRISINGHLSDEEDATISVLDRGFLYGDSVYEVLRTYGGRPFALAEHFNRLERSASLLDIPLPISRSALIDEVHDATESAGNDESYVRVIITRGGGPIGLDPALATRANRVIIVTTLKLLDEETYTRGVKVCVVAAGRSSAGQLPAGAKSGNYLTNLLALRLAKQRGAQEALLLDAEGRICEGSSSNIFTLRDGVIRTPTLEVGILEGITRCKVLTLAREAGFAVEETDIRPEDLYGADEVFLTSTIREVLAVTQVDDTTIAEGHPGPIARKLRADLRAIATIPPPLEP